MKDISLSRRAVMLGVAALPMAQQAAAQGRPKPVVVSISLPRRVTVVDPTVAVSTLSNSTVWLPAATVKPTENCPPKTGVAKA